MICQPNPADGGRQEDKPVGLTYIGVSLDGRTEVREYHWPGGRANRMARVEAAINLGR